MAGLILDAVGACGLLLIFASRRRRTGQAVLRRTGGILLAIAVLGRLGAGFLALGRTPG